jgi:hypothetical protein
MSDGLLDLARERAESSPIPADWGYRLVLEVGESFQGRWRGEVEDPDNVDDRGKPRRVFLLWDGDGEPAFVRSYSSLARQVDQFRPAVGDRFVIVRSADYTTQRGAGHSYGFACEKCAEPLPGTASGESSVELPF